MIVFLSERDVESAIGMSGAMEIVESAFRDYALERATLLPRMSETLPGTAGMFRVLGAYLPQQGMFGSKTLTGFPGRRLDSEVYFTVLLFETATGALKSVISTNYLTGLRTGAASGVAARYLARPDAHTLGMVGAGVQAWHQAEALCAVREVRTAKVFSRNQQKAEKFAERMAKAFSIEAKAVGSAEEAVRQSDLVVAATTSSQPVIQGEWLMPGAHVSGIGANTRTKRELDTSCFVGAKIVADSRDQAIAESGDLREAVESGAISAGSVYAELGEICAAQKPGRTSEDEITIFKSIGVALQDISVAAFLFETAQRRGIGTLLDPFAAGSFLAENGIAATSFTE